jgi:hypothetical protein
MQLRNFHEIIRNYVFLIFNWLEIFFFLFKVVVIANKQKKKKIGEITIAI